MLPKLEDIVIGEVAVIAVAIKNSAGLAADPSALRLITKSPSGLLTTYVFGVAIELVKDSVGNYHANVLMNEAGGWAYRWEADAPNAGANEGRITVKKSIVI